MSSKSDFITSIGILVHGESLKLGETEKIKALDMAIKEHSRQRPNVLVVDVTGDDTFEFKCTTIMTYWKEGFSAILSIEYPVDDDDETPDMLEDDSIIKSYQKSDGEYFRFLEDTPTDEEEFRLKYTAPHVIADDSSTIDYNDEEAVEMLAAAFFCQFLAAAYAQNTDSMISADSANHTNQSNAYRKQAAEYRKLYFNHIGVKEGEIGPACAIDDQD